jgi:hypothetical protein
MVQVSAVGGRGHGSLAGARGRCAGHPQRGFRPVAATAIPVMRPSACLMFMIAPLFPDTVSPDIGDCMEERLVRSIGRMTCLPPTVFPDHAAKPRQKDGYPGTRAYM